MPRNSVGGSYVRPKSTRLILSVKAVNLRCSLRNMKEHTTVLVCSCIAFVEKVTTLLDVSSNKSQLITIHVSIHESHKCS